MKGKDQPANKRAHNEGSIHHSHQSELHVDKLFQHSRNVPEKKRVKFKRKNTSTRKYFRALPSEHLEEGFLDLERLVGWIR